MTVRRRFEEGSELRNSFATASKQFRIVFATAPQRFRNSFVAHLSGMKMVPQVFENACQNDAKCTKGLPMMRKAIAACALRIIGMPPPIPAHDSDGLPMMRK